MNIVHPVRRKFDLTLYLVTDSTPAILGSKDLNHVVEEAIKGGVSIVQYRDKHADTGLMIERATRLLEVTRRHGVPLLINDRVDVCLAVDADGVHLGQEDMDVIQARKILGPDAIIGISASSVEEARQAINHGADYLGIGTMFSTTTKLDTKLIIGTRGAQMILSECQVGSKFKTSCVAIGSVNASNVQRVMHQSSYQDNRLNGVAVVSAIMGSANPQASAHQLRDLIESSANIFYASSVPGKSVSLDIPNLLKEIPALVRTHFNSSVLCHNMTNTVVQNFAANVCLATGSSPIMSLNGPEAADLAKLKGSLVINMGTVTPDTLETYLMGMRAYNAHGNPILLDPVGGGATDVRRAAIKQLLAGGFFDIIKGNEGEINAVMGDSSIQQRGVDSAPSTTTAVQKAKTVKMLSLRERCIVLMTGATDYISDGDVVFAVSNGSHWLGKITGSGCALGSVIASYVALHKEYKLLAALAGLLHYEIAAERAAERSEVRGPGTFIPAFLDELYILGKTISEGGDVWFNKRAKIVRLEVE